MMKDVLNGLALLPFEFLNYNIVALCSSKNTVLKL